MDAQVGLKSTPLTLFLIFFSISSHPCSCSVWWFLIGWQCWNMKCQDKFFLNQLDWFGKCCAVVIDSLVYNIWPNMPGSPIKGIRTPSRANLHLWTSMSSSASMRVSLRVLVATSALSLMSAILAYVHMLTWGDSNRMSEKRCYIKYYINILTRFRSM